MTLKAENFVVEGLTEDERLALEGGAAEDAAELAADAAAVKAIEDGDEGDNSSAPASDAAAATAAADKAAVDKANADKVAADKLAADKAAADKAANPEDPAAKKAADTEAGKADADAEAIEAAPVRQVVPDWKAPENAKAQLDAIAAKRDALAEQFDNGELTAKQLFAETGTLDRQERAIERARDRAEDAIEMTHAVWLQSTVPAFLDANPRYRDNPAWHTLLDGEVRRLQVEASKAGKDPLAASILAEADKAIKKTLGAPDVDPAAKVDPPKPLKPTKPGGIPPTLAGLPAADISGTDSKWASLDRLGEANPTAFEDAFGKLPEAERNAYLAAH